MFQPLDLASCPVNSVVRQTAFPGGKERERKLGTLKDISGDCF